MSNPAYQEIVCCLGQPVAGNPMQFMIEKALAEASLDWRFLTLEISPENLAAAVAGVKAMGFRGGSIAAPHKTAVLAHVDGFTEAADLCGAVNCVFREGDRLIGDNTEGKGFLQAIRNITDPAGKKTVILGAGCAARAIAVELALVGAGPLVIVNRTESHGQALVRILNEKVKAEAEYVLWENDYSVAEDAQLVIHATSIGIDAAQKLPVVTESLHHEMLATDIAYDPPQTQFLDDAAQNGCKTLDGVGMLVNQAALSFRTWTGIDPNVQTLQDSLEEFLEL